jgi:hypothetical protein
MLLFINYTKEVMVVTNRYLLAIISNNIQEFDKNFDDLLKETDISLLTKRMFEKENRAIYKIDTSVKGLILLKSKLDEISCCSVVDIYKREEW